MDQGPHGRDGYGRLRVNFMLGSGTEATLYEVVGEVTLLLDLHVVQVQSIRTLNPHAAVGRFRDGRVCKDTDCMCIVVCPVPYLYFRRCSMIQDGLIPTEHHGCFQQTRHTSSLVWQCGRRPYGCEEPEMIQYTKRCESDCILAVVPLDARSLSASHVIQISIQSIHTPLHM